MTAIIDFLWGKFLRHKSEAALYVQNSLPGTLVYFAVVTIMITIYQVVYYLALPAAFFAQFLVSQFLHSRHTFKIGKLSAKSSFAYFASFFAVSLFEYLLAIGLVEVLRVGQWISSILVIFIAGVVSFFLTMRTMTNGHNQ